MMFPSYDPKKNGRSFSEHLTDLTTLLASFETAMATGIGAALKDPATLQANGEAFAAFASVVPPIPTGRISPAVGSVQDELGIDYPHALLAATRMGWSAAVGSLMPMLIARGADPVQTGTELCALQAALATEPAPKLAPTRRTLVWRQGPARLWKLGSDEVQEGVPTVVVASLVNRFTLLDLLDGQSLLQALEGPKYLLDWEVDDSDLEGILGHLHDALARFEQVKLVGYSMGGTLAAIHAARHDNVARLAVFGSPIDTTRGGSFAEWSAHADLDAVAAYRQAVPAAWVHAPFWALRPSVNLLKLTQLVQRWRQPDYLRRFLAVELWNNDNVDISAPLYRSWGTALYQDNALWTGELADLSAIDCPVLAIAAKHDGIVPAACTLALAEAVPNGTPVTIPGGHVGALSGRKGLAALVATLNA